MSGIVNRIVVGVLLASLVGILLIGLDEQWVYGHHGATGAYRSLIGRNYVRHGFIETGFAPILNVGQPEDNEIDYRWNHPILANVLVGFTVGIFGERYWPLRLLNLLMERELCVCELCEVLDIAQPNISRHVAYLRRAGLVTVRQVGKWRYCAVPRRPTGLHRTLIRCVRECLRDIDVLQEDLARLREVHRQCGC